MEFSMAKKTQNTIAEYDENFVNSISLKNINSAKELKELLDKLEKADQVVTEYYRTLYTDHIMFINSSNKYAPDEISLENVKKYKLLASKIHKAYNYVMYISTFENPFKSSNITKG